MFQSQFCFIALEKPEWGRTLEEVPYIKYEKVIKERSDGVVPQEENGLKSILKLLYA